FIFVGEVECATLVPYTTLFRSVDEGFGSWVVARKLPQFQELYPNIDIDLVTTSSFLDPSKREVDVAIHIQRPETGRLAVRRLTEDRKSTRLNSSHVKISYAVFC